MTRTGYLLAWSLAALVASGCGALMTDEADIPGTSTEWAPSGDEPMASADVDADNEPAASLADADPDAMDSSVDEPEIDPEIDPAAELAADRDDELAAETASDVVDDGARVLAQRDDADDDAGQEEAADEADAAGDADLAAGEASSVSTQDNPAVQEALASIPTKIRYVLVIVKENHTFDNYFTGFPGATSSVHAWKFDKQTKRRVRFLRPIAPPDKLASGPGHTHAKAVAAYRDGHMDGFGINPGKTPYIRYTQHQIPHYWKYASEYVLADHMFSTSLAPSAPGHEVFWFSRSTAIDNPRCHLPGGIGCGTGCLGTHLTATTFNPTTGTTRTVAPCFDLPSLPDHLPRGFTWFDYGGQMAKQIKSVSKVSVPAHYGSSAKLLRDLRAGTLHNLMIAHISGGEISEHPTSGPCKGERFTVEAVNAAMKLPQWKQMAIIVTWDDWGGFYDHVKPPVRTSRNGQQFGSGFRLPLIIISPYAKQGVVLKRRTEQASVPRLVEELWGMKFMSTRNAHARDGVAGSLLGAFDFGQAPRPPMILTPRSCPGDPKK